MGSQRGSVSLMLDLVPSGHASVSPWKLLHGKSFASDLFVSEVHMLKEKSDFCSLTSWFVSSVCVSLFYWLSGF